MNLISLKVAADSFEWLLLCYSMDFFLKENYLARSYVILILDRGFAEFVYGNTIIMFFNKNLFTLDRKSVV